MQLLNNGLMKLVLLVVVVAAVLVGINMNHKKLGKQYALLATLVVLVVASYGGYTLMGASEEEPEEENTMPSPANAELEMDNDTVGNAANVVIEGFQSQDQGQGESQGEGEVQDEGEGESPVEVTGFGDSPTEGSFSGSGNRNECLPRDVLNPDELLPSSLSPNNWDTPANPGGLDGPNFLNPEHLVGINTVGQSLRNANRQLRSEPPNPQVKVSPWLQTTIEPDINRKPLEIGETCA
jgi:hypothetical protein